VTYNVSNSLVSVDILLHDTILVDTDRGEQIKSTLVARVDTVENQAHNNLLPSGAALVPELGLLQVDNVADVLHYTVQSTGSEDLVFVVVGDGDEQLCVAVVHCGTQIVTVLEGEVVGVACRGRVWQLSEANEEMLELGYLQRMCVNSSLPLSRSLRYFAWMAFWMAEGTG
jgi:hypothetical protein